jgi:hypothetical protein
MQRFEGQELQATIDNARSAAIANATDPRRVSVELGRAVDAIRQHAPRLGLGPEQIKAEVEKTTSATHVGVIEQLLYTDQTRSAQVYYEETKGAIKGEAIGRIEKALADGKLHKQAEQEANMIISAGGTLTEQREKIKGIGGEADTELRDEVRRRIEHEATVTEHAEREQHEAGMRGVYDTIDKGTTPGALERMPFWSKMTGGERGGALSYLEHRAAGVPIRTDWATYYKLRELADEAPDDFVKTNLLAYRGKLDDGEFSRLEELRSAIRQGRRSPKDEEIGGFRNVGDIIKDSLTAYGIPTKESEQGAGDAQAIAQLRRMVDVRLATLGKKDPDKRDVQGIVDDLLSRKESTAGSWWNLWRPKEKRLIDLTIDDVPGDQRTDLERALRAKGRPVSDATVLDLYLEIRARKR